jgi:hypothetical protein
MVRSQPRAYLRRQRIELRQGFVESSALHQQHGQVVARREGIRGTRTATRLLRRQQAAQQRLGTDQVALVFQPVGQHAARHQCLVVALGTIGIEPGTGAAHQRHALGGMPTLDEQ